MDTILVIATMMDRWPKSPSSSGIKVMVDVVYHWLFIYSKWKHVVGTSDEKITLNRSTLSKNDIM
jgi:hypothetical protein